MKLRIKGDSLRLRLTKGEVDQFHTEGRIADQTRFPSGRVFVYALAVAAEQDAVSAQFEGDTITIHVPQTLATGWATTEQVGFRGEVALGDGETLRILVEKDFHCLVPRPDEDESDHYANPLAAK